MSQIFMSYSQADEEYKELLVTHLIPLLRDHEIRIWSDHVTESGDDWRQETKESLEQSDLAIVLLSPNYLASYFLYETELPQLLNRQAKEGLLIVPVLIRPCAWEVTEFRSMQVFPQKGKAISSLDATERDKILVEIVNRINEFIEVVELKKQESQTISQPIFESSIDTTDAFVFICHSSEDYDFAELMKLKLERAGISAWIDTDRLQVGVDWRQEIDEAISRAIALVVIMTPEARESEYVTYEWAYAWGNSVKVLPVMLRKTQLHPRLESLQYLDFSNKRARPWSQLISEIKKNKE